MMLARKSTDKEQVQWDFAPELNIGVDVATYELSADPAGPSFSDDYSSGADVFATVTGGHPGKVYKLTCLARVTDGTREALSNTLRVLAP